jgi:hypothetical protein
MRNTIHVPASILASAAVALPTAAGVLWPGISGVNGSADASFDISGFRAGLDADDFGEARLDANIDRDSLASGVFWSDLSEAEVDLGPTSGRIASDATFEASSQFFSYRQSVSALGRVAEGDQLGGGFEANGNILVSFDAPTLVDIVIRLEVAEPLIGDDASAFIRLSGIDGQAPIRLVYNGGDPAGIQEFAIRTTIDSPRAVSFDFDTDLSLNPAQGFPVEFASIEFFGSITVVPTPGAAAMLALGGLIAARRRR